MACGVQVPTKPTLPTVRCCLGLSDDCLAPRLPRNGTGLRGRRRTSLKGRNRGPGWGLLRRLQADGEQTAGAPVCDAEATVVTALPTAPGTVRDALERACKVAWQMWADEVGRHDANRAQRPAAPGTKPSR
jgi:hypothetical protein